MSEQDLGLKVATRRLYWSMGMATRLNVKLSTHVSTGSSRAKTEEFTDLDVLGIGQSPDGRLNTAIGDCKTVRRAANERCFWLRGVADFFAASTAHLVRSHDVPVSTRQLAERLRLGVLTEPDLAALQAWYQSPPPSDVEVLFDPGVVQRQQALLTTLDTQLSRLQDFRNLGYWIVEPHRTIDGVIHHLSLASEHLDAKHPAHRVLMFDMTWLFCLSLIHATSRVRETHASNVEVALTQHLFGGPAGLRDKQNQAELIRRVTSSRSKKKDFDILPAYFPGLLEVVTRHLRRPTTLTTLLRYAEWLSVAPAESHLRKVSVADVFGDSFDPIAGKLLGDTIRFLVNAARLPEGFLELIELTLPAAAEAGSDKRTKDGVQGELPVETTQLLRDEKQGAEPVESAETQPSA